MSNETKKASAISSQRSEGGYKELADENERLKAALNYIALLANIENPHLGHPRASDKDCIFCMSYFALNNGAYGYNITKDQYVSMFNAKKEGI